MTKYSLRARMMILILAPTLLIGLLLSTFFVVHRYNELQEQLVDAGASIIEPLAVASEYGMTFRSRESVRQLVSLLHRRHSDIVRSITVFDAQNNLFVTSNYHHNFAQLQIERCAIAHRSDADAPRRLADSAHADHVGEPIPRRGCRKRRARRQ